MHSLCCYKTFTSNHKHPSKPMLIYDTSDEPRSVEINWPSVVSQWKRTWSKFTISTLTNEIMANIWYHHCIKSTTIHPRSAEISSFICCVGLSYRILSHVVPTTHEPYLTPPNTWYVLLQIALTTYIIIRIWWSTMLTVILLSMVNINENHVFTLSNNIGLTI